MQSVSSIQTLEQAELTIRRAGIVQNEMVEGKQLLEICGFSLSNPSQEIARQISKHSLVEGVDFANNMIVNGKARNKITSFTVNAANHILLAAMTAEGKAARQEAIDLKRETVSLYPQQSWLTGNEFS